jgi:hypothetical protein
MSVAVFDLASGEVSRGGIVAKKLSTFGLGEPAVHLAIVYEIDEGDLQRMVSDVGLVLRARKQESQKRQQMQDVLDGSWIATAD